MRKLRNILALSLAVVAFSLVNANAQDSSALARSIDIGKQVQKSILKLPRYEVFDHIDFTVNGGVVTLTGKVRNAINKNDAEGNVKRIAGVTAVVNNIEVLPVGGLMKISDATCTRASHEWAACRDIFGR